MKKIVSGGQTGADIAGLIVAKKYGLETGGWMPDGWLTEEGPRPEYEKMYGMKKWYLIGEIHVNTHMAYVLRTKTNVKDSDGTIRLASDWKSPGETCTLKAVWEYGKPHIDVDVRNPIPIEEVITWIKDNNIETLNVAGNRESKSLGIEVFVTEYMSRMLEAMGFAPVT